MRAVIITVIIWKKIRSLALVSGIWEPPKVFAPLQPQGGLLFSSSYHE